MGAIAAWGRLGSMAILMTLAACGGGGGGGMAPIPAPPPAPPPPPPPPPPPTPTTLSIVTPGVAMTAEMGGVRDVTDALPSSQNVTFTVSDPDAPNAQKLTDIVFDGDEVLQVRLADPVVNYEEHFGADNHVSAGRRFYQGTRPPVANDARYVPARFWRTPLAGDNEALLFLYELEEVLRTSPEQGGNTTDFVRLFEIQSGGGRAFQVVGEQSPASAIPTSGQASYLGESIGHFILNGRDSYFAGDVTMNVDFAAATTPVSGHIDIHAFQNSQDPLPPAFRIDFTANISGSAIVGDTVTVTGLGNSFSGTLQGDFYGPAADEVGGVFSASSPTATIAGGFVAGKSQ